MNFLQLQKDANPFPSPNPLSPFQQKLPCQIHFSPCHPLRLSSASTQADTSKNGAQRQPYVELRRKGCCSGTRGHVPCSLDGETCSGRTGRFAWGQLGQRAGPRPGHRAGGQQPADARSTSCHGGRGLTASGQEDGVAGSCVRDGPGVHPYFVKKGLEAHNQPETPG